MATETIHNIGTHTNYQSTVSELTASCFYNNIAPSLCGFVNWILHSAVEKKIDTLYFLARDGFLLLKIAEKLLEKEKLNINCKYLYCSRMSLRLAALKVVPKNEAFDFLLSSGVNVTPHLLLSRLMLGNAERNSVYNDISFFGDEDAPLSKDELAKFSEKLRSSRQYLNCLSAKGSTHYENTIGYLSQTIDFSENFAFVDSGWVGSIQHTFRVLFDSMHKNIVPKGYYFGLFNIQNKADGEYFTYFFNYKSSPAKISKFNNHLFEAICSAPHGMTIDYQLDKNGFVPLFFSEKSLNANSAIYDMQNIMTEKYIFENNVEFDEKAIAIQRNLLYNLMYRPPADFAADYGALMFSDDPSEERTYPLAQELGAEKLNELFVFRRLYQKYFGKNAGNSQTPVYWIYGSLALTAKAGIFHRFNARLWEELWLMKRQKSH